MSARGVVPAGDVPVGAGSGEAGSGVPVSGDPEPVAGEPGPAPGDRATELLLARLHLRVGLLGLARAELETFAGTAELDLPGILDLAEVRWRTGDMRGAGEAAAAYLALAARAGLEPDGPVAYAIVAEAAAMRGHESEAVEAVAGTLAILRAGLGDDAAVEPALDRLFAGIEPRGPWPEPDEDVIVPPAMPRRLPWELPPGAAGVEPGGLPDAGVAVGPQEPVAPPPVADLLAAGRDALVAGDAGRAAVTLGLALRSDPGSAPAIIAAVKESGTIVEAGAGTGDVVGPVGAVAPDPGRASLAVVHGDALRAAGRDVEAAFAYDLARQLAAPGDEAATEPGIDETPPPAGDDPGSRQSPGGSP